MREKEMPFKLNFLKPNLKLTTKSKQKISVIHLLMGLVFVAFAAYMLFVPQEKVVVDYSLKEGDIVKDDIIINKTITVQDKDATERNRQQAIDNVVPVYEFFTEKQRNTTDMIRRFFNLIAASRKEYEKNKKSKEELIRIKELISVRLGLEVSNFEVRSILESQFFQEVELEELLNVIKSLFEKRIISSTTGAQQSKDGTIKLVFRNEAREPEVLKLDRVYDKKSVETALLIYVKGLEFRVDNRSAEFITSILMEFIDANVSYSRILTRKEEQDAAAAVNPVMISLKAGKVILRKGDEVRAKDMKILDLIALESRSLEQKLSNFYLIALILLFLMLYGGKFFNIWVSSGINKDKLFGVTGATLLVSVLLYRASLFLVPLILKNINVDIQYDMYSIYYALPFGFGALVVAFTFNLQSAVIYSFVNALLGGIICGWDFLIFLYVLLGNLAVSYGIEYYQRLKRSPIIKASLLFYLPINLVVIFLFHVTREDLDLLYLLVAMLMGFFSAMVSPILANFIIPVWEILFKLVTELKLIELTNLNLPIFREMLEKAPGTYHHSQMVASLSEAAAQDLGLSPLLCRAMALYHDIGKIDNPHFFTENHTIYPNPHDNLPPRESAKNITSHIPQGIERADKLKLPVKVMSSVIQHHGTKRVHYFYDKAKEQSSIDSDGIDDKVFRYQGEKPRDIENAIIMLADQVEAASKSLAAPTDEEIKNVIQKIIDANIEEEQFDECEGLTFKTLNIMARSFLKKLSSIYHMRISYPGFDFKEKENTDEHQVRTFTGTDRIKTIS
jgi:cyclic-di-AMP phosphodiesterase PgpH